MMDGEQGIWLSLVLLKASIGPLWDRCRKLDKMDRWLDPTGLFLYDVFSLPRVYPQSGCRDVSRFASRTVLANNTLVHPVKTFPFPMHSPYFPFPSLPCDSFRASIISDSFSCPLFLNICFQSLALCWRHLTLQLGTRAPDGYFPVQCCLTKVSERQPMCH